MFSLLSIYCVACCDVDFPLGLINQSINQSDACFLDVAKPKGIREQKGVFVFNTLFAVPNTLILVADIYRHTVSPGSHITSSNKPSNDVVHVCPRFTSFNLLFSLFESQPSFKLSFSGSLDRIVWNVSPAVMSLCVCALYKGHSWVSKINAVFTFWCQSLCPPGSNVTILIGECNLKWVPKVIYHWIGLPCVWNCCKWMPKRNNEVGSHGARYIFQSSLLF